MSYTIDVLKKPLYLHLKVAGENSLKSVREYLMEVLEICARNNCLNVLIEENLVGQRLNTLDVFNVVRSGLSHAGRYPQVIAYIDVNAGQEPGLMLFAESLAVNRGINIRVFNSVHDAEAWLESTLRADPGTLPPKEN